MGLKKIGLEPNKDVTLRVIGGSTERMVALQKGIVQFTVVTEAGKAQAEKLGYPMVVDMASLQNSFSPERRLHFDKADPGKSGYGPALYACLHRSDPLLQNP